SRGAAAATLLDADASVLARARATATARGESGRVMLLDRDATAPGPAPRRHDLAFLDPPYHAGLAGPALAALAAEGWLAPRALVALECAARGPEPEPPAGFERLMVGGYGAARVVLRRAPSRRATVAPHAFTCYRESDPRHSRPAAGAP
ncbi:MAG: RsmD family RNA methyltransferase, partial [Alphaproteobacteria bacterium]